MSIIQGREEMSLNWIEVSNLSFNVILLLERAQLAWLPGWLPEPELATALKAHPVVEWFLRHKNPDLNPWVDSVLMQANPEATPEQVRSAEETILHSINDLVVYAVYPTIYDNIPGLGWDDTELSGLTDFHGKTVIDVGAGTGRLTFVAAKEGAHAVFAVEPVGNLRIYLKAKTCKLGYCNVYPVDGLITEIPFPNAFADVTMGGHVFGDEPEAECRELIRVTRPGGMVILCPGNNDCDEGHHQFLLDQGFQWSRFEEPGDGMKRKYWKTIT
ncbi:MAG: class I SAM-dependent methyltransferase [Chloroflexota bacterium]